MTDLILFALASVGMAAIIVHGSIFAPLRRALAAGAEKNHALREQKHSSIFYAFVEVLHNLVGCMQCTGFWCGLFCGTLLVVPDFVEPDPFELIRWLCCGFAGSILSSFFDLIAEAIAVRNEMVKQQLMSMTHHAHAPEEQHVKEAEM